jgi:hypothetical protein
MRFFFPTASVCRRFVAAVAFTWTWLPAPATARANDDLAGEQIYRKQCASCHGAKGEGVEDEYDRPLAGERSLAELTRFIAKTMPKNAPKKCSAAEAQKVAAYIYEAFYSKEAQARNKPARIELSRLTVRQYRNAVADLIGTFRTSGRLDERRGLHGDYFKSRQRRGGGERVIDRVDGEVNFNFGFGPPKWDNFGIYGPEPEKFDVNQFSIRWEGSVLAPDSGEYEFIVKTEHAVQLWVNDIRRPLIDALVKSGSDNEYHATINLLGGRAYPLRLEFSKAKQGVDDSKTKKPPALKASIALEWKPPRGVAEVIPRRCLTPTRFPELAVVETPFPPDDRSIGYERGTSISKAWDGATTDAAIEVAGYISTRLGELADARDGATDREAKLRAFYARFAERAFRRPLTAAQKQLYVDHQFEGTKDLDAAGKRALLFILKSPRFLYREVGGERDTYDVASRISFALWDSLPDQELLDAAAKGALATREQVARQVERMLGDLRGRAKLREFLFQWLKIDQVAELAKDAKQFPGFDKAIAADLRASLDLFLDDVIWSEASDFRQLLLADYVFLNGRLAKFYGTDLPANAPFQKVSFQPGERAGVLTHPYLMSTFAYTASTSPIHRGVFLARGVLGLTLKPPPEAFSPLAPELHPDLTTRERVLLQTRPQACQSCHAMINPLGFTLEHFDAVGRYRDKEKGKPIDSTGVYLTRSGKEVKVAGIRDLATFLAGSEETQESFVRQLFQYLVKQPIVAFGPGKLGDLCRSFADKQYNVRKLMVEIVTEAALDQRRR